MATKKTRSASSCKFVYPTDEATQYALKVHLKETMAGPAVRAACARHLRDLEHGHLRGLVWSVPHVERVLKFFRKVLCLNGGDFEGKPFDPLDWQCFILGSLFGWLRFGDDRRYGSTLLTPEQLADELASDVGLYRRFRVAYQETGKGSGKSPLAAGVGLYMMIADNEPRAEIYAAATKKDQAMILYRDVIAMVDQSKPLKSRLKQSGRQPNVWNLSHLASNSFFKPIAADEGQSGPRPHCALIDEVHEHKTPTVIEMLRAGFKFRKQPLLFMITNSGADKTSVCYDYHEYGIKVSEGNLEDDTFFSYVAGHDKGEDPFLPECEQFWPKSNPSIGQTFKPQYLHDQVRQARGMPSKESTVRRLNFCQWTQAYDPWVTNDVWEDNSAAPVPLAGLSGDDCVAGLDLSMKNDLSALVLSFEHSDGTISVHPFFWVPEDGIKEKEEKDRVPYTAWARAGLITLVPGPVIEYSFIAQAIADIIGSYNLLRLNFDRYRILDLNKALKDIGIEYHDEDENPMKPHGQGFKDMNPSIEFTEDLLKTKRLRHGNHPVLRWCVSNAVVVKDPAELRKFDKARATGRIDGAVALVMANRAFMGDIDESGALDEFLTNPIILG